MKIEGRLFQLGLAGPQLAGAQPRTRSRQPSKGRKESSEKYIIDNRIILSRAPEGPLAKYIGRFERAMRGQGYARYSLYRQVLLAACFSEWLRKRDVALRGISSDHPQQ